MSDTLKAALIALLGTVILAPLMVRGLTWLRGCPARLLVRDVVVRGAIYFVSKSDARTMPRRVQFEEQRKFHNIRSTNKWMEGSIEIPQPPIRVTFESVRTCQINVRSWGQSGRHLLMLSVSQFDPTRTFEFSMRY
jgi:hypothetical protein